MRKYYQKKFPPYPRARAANELQHIISHTSTLLKLEGLQVGAVRDQLQGRQIKVYYRPEEIDGEQRLNGLSPKKKRRIVTGEFSPHRLHSVLEGKRRELYLHSLATRDILHRAQEIASSCDRLANDVCKQFGRFWPWHPPQCLQQGPCQWPLIRAQHCSAC